jgi:hypothetical protein
MDQFSQLIALIVACGVGILSVIFILRRQRRDTEAASAESPFAVSTEGEKRCPKCGMGNLWTQARCISCGSKLPG